VAAGRWNTLRALRSALVEQLRVVSYDSVRLRCGPVRERITGHSEVADFTSSAIPRGVPIV
jgi:hypothetical protein